MKFSKQFKKSFSYTWYLYVLAIVVPTVLFPLSYSFMHRAKQNETLSLFIPVNEKDGAEDKLFEEFKDLEIRKAEVITSDYVNNEYEFAKKISVIAYNRCDLIILPAEKVDSIGIETAALELTSDVMELCKISGETLYPSDKENKYGVMLPKNTPLTEIAELSEEKDFYAFLSAKSWNIGEYSPSKKYTDNAFKFMQYALGKYEKN